MSDKQINNIISLLEQCADSKEDIEQIKDMRQTVKIEQSKRETEK